MTNKAKRCGYLEGVPDTKGGVPTSRSGSQSKFHHGGPYVVYAYAKIAVHNQFFFYLWSLDFERRIRYLPRMFLLNEKSLNLVVIRRILVNRFILAHLSR